MAKKKAPKSWKKCKPLPKPKRKVKLNKDARFAPAERHELFCLEYSKPGVEGSNATQAAIAAGYAEVGAGVEGCRLLKNPKILNRIKQLIAERNARVLMDGDDILREIQKLAKSDVRRLFNQDTGCILPMNQWPDDIAVCVSSVKVKELYNPLGINIGNVTEVKLWDKPKPQEMMGRNKKLFVDVVESDNKHTLAVVDSKAVADEVKKLESDV